MFTRLANSWELVKASAAVLQQDRELLLFPLVSALASLLVMATFAVPMFLAGLFEAMFADEFGAARIAGYVVAFAFYLVQYFVVLFANAALVGAAMIRLDGGDPTVGDGFRIAWQHVGAIFGYAAIAATVGLILRALSERGTLGRLVSSLAGLVWSVATYLVVPVLVVEGVGPVEAVKRSGSLLKQTWGEQIAGNFSINTIFGLLIVLVVVGGVAATAFVVATTQSIPLIVTTAALFVLLAVGLGLVSSTLSGIYAAAVYRYAETGETGGFFRRELVEGAFRPK